MPFNNMRLDFALICAQIAIEVNGDYWHGVRQQTVDSHQLKKKLADASKQTALLRHGWTLISFAASDLKRLSAHHVYCILLNRMLL